MTTDTIRYIPLDKLVLSPKNTRKQRTPEAIEQMAASIAAQGLLQNLTVEPSSNDPDVYEVIAGGTRMVALQQLQRDQVHGNVPVPCRIVTNGAAIEASAAENLVRTRLAPADEFDAFKAMADNGRSRLEIAQHFGVPEIVVSRSLKLANVDPKLLQVFRSGSMDLDQLQALAITDDHEEQRQAWYGPKYDHERAAWQIRERLTQRDVRSTNMLARFVGIQAYEAAGGKLRRDLFEDDVWFSDGSLLDSLAMDRLDAAVQELLDTGWSWAEARLQMDYSQRNEYPRGFSDDLAQEGQLTPEQEARAAEIAKRVDEIENIDADDLDEATEQALRQELDELEEEQAALDSQRRMVWPEHVMKQAGCLVTISHGGKLDIEWARLRPGQNLTSEGAVTGKPKPTQAEKAANAKAKPKAPMLSGDMQERLHLHHRAATRLAVANDANLAIELLLAQLLAGLFGSAGAGTSLFGVRVNNHHRSDLDGKAVKFADVKASPARKALDDTIAKLKKVLPRKASDIQAWLGSRSVDELHQLLALIAAVAFDPSKHNAGAVAAATKVDMADFWKPDADHYLGHVTKALIADAVRDVHGKDMSAKVGAMKAGPAAAEAAKLLVGTRWLPKPLRGDGYKHITPGKAKPAAKASAAKKPAVKKVAAKKAAKQAPAKKAPAKKSSTKAAAA